MPTEVAYFLKADPREKLYVGDGSFLLFQDVGNNQGTLIVGKPYWIEQIRDCVRRQVGGVEEISYAQYQDLQKKKTPTLPQNSRELVSVQQIRDGMRAHNAAKSAGGDNARVSSRFGKTAGVLEPIEYKPVAPGFKPQSVKR